MPRMEVMEMSFAKPYPLLVDELAKGRAMEKILRKQLRDDE